ncbi:MAG: DUF1993 domain-containing protein [Myxococcota bacterium]|nr:DUF1993 domain-containing protein [Myxococcota bacterium]
MSLYEVTVPQMAKMLNNMKAWMAEAEQYAEERGFHPDNYLNARLQMDQFPFSRQLQAACDTAKGSAARLSGQTPPRHEDNEATFEELRARIDTVLTYLAGFSASDFDGWETRLVPLPFLSGKGASAASYATEFALPNFYFHVSMVYGILRHSGVKLGKRAYIGGMQIVDL